MWLSMKPTYCGDHSNGFSALQASHEQPVYSPEGGVWHIALSTTLLSPISTNASNISKDGFFICRPDKNIALLVPEVQ